MTKPTEFGQHYYRRLPNFRTTGSVYHARLSIHPGNGKLKTDREFEVIQNSIIYVHQRKCLVYADVIMANHTHLVFQPLPKKGESGASSDYREYHEVEATLGSIKKYTARIINKMRGCAGKSLWKEESFDRVVRNERDLHGLVDYIHGNPIRWGLVARPEEYRWSSASTLYIQGKRNIGTGFR